MAEHSGRRGLAAEVKVESDYLQQLSHGVFALLLR